MGHFYGITFVLSSWRPDSGLALSIWCGSQMPVTVHDQAASASDRRLESILPHLEDKVVRMFDRIGHHEQHDPILGSDDLLDGLRTI